MEEGAALWTWGDEPARFVQDGGQSHACAKWVRETLCNCIELTVVEVKLGGNVG